ncbi:MAG: diguanylate cyclase [Campylobacterales bacterium]|nr:diguanylate cyclase [Campylobacterales bacterium]
MSHIPSMLSARLTMTKSALLHRWKRQPCIRNLYQRLQSEASVIAAGEALLDAIIAEASVRATATQRLDRALEALVTLGLRPDELLDSINGYKHLLRDELQAHPVLLLHLYDQLDNALSQQMRRHCARAQQESAYAKIIKEHVVLSVTDTKGVVTAVSDAFCTLTGYSKEEWIGNTHAIIRHPDIPDSMFIKMWHKIKQGEEFRAIMKNRKRNGQTFLAKTRIVPVRDDTGAISEYVAIREDITDMELINYDPLTGLYNRRMFDTLYPKMVDEAQLDSTALSLLIVDLDHFKRINDTFGHKTGDAVLIQTARVLQKNLRQGDACARWGGEEFAVLLPKTTLEEAAQVASRIRLNIAAEVRAQSEAQSCSIGVAALRALEDAESLFNRADAALYRAKNSGRNRVESD